MHPTGHATNGKSPLGHPNCQSEINVEQAYAETYCRLCLVNCIYFLFPAFWQNKYVGINHKGQDWGKCHFAYGRLRNAKTKELSGGESVRLKVYV